MLCRAVQKKWKVRHYNFQNAFQNGVSERFIYAYPPKHTINEENYKNKIFKLRRYLYGLKKAAKIWYETVSLHINLYGLKEMDSAPCVFHIKGLVVICYVDDLLIFFNDESEIRKFGTNLEKKFVTKDLGQSKQFLRIEIICHVDEIIGLTQFSLITNLISKYGIEQGRRALCAMGASENEQSDTQLLYEKQARNYSNVVGSLLYIALKTRLDIVTSASVLGTFGSCPLRKHYTIAQRVLHYLRGTEQYALKLFPKESN